MYVVQHHQRRSKSMNPHLPFPTNQKLNLPKGAISTLFHFSKGISKIYYLHNTFCVVEHERRLSNHFSWREQEKLRKKYFPGNNISILWYGMSLKTAGGIITGFYTLPPFYILCSFSLFLPNDTFFFSGLLFAYILVNLILLILNKKTSLFN